MKLSEDNTIQKENNLLPNDSLLSGIIGIGSSSIVLQTYSATILAQPDIKLNILPDLPAAQKDARSSADNWIKQINKLAIGSLVDVRSYANKFDSYSELLLPLAEKIEAGDIAQLPIFIKGLQQLIETAQENANNTEILSDGIDNFQNNIEANIDFFSKAEQQIQKEVTSHKGKIDQIRKDLNDLNSRINSDITKIAASVAAEGIGVGLIILGASTLIPTAGISTMLIGAGITATIGGTSITIQASADINDAQDNWAKKFSEIVDLELEVAVFDTVEHNISSNLIQAKSALQAATKMNDGWVRIANDYSQTIKDLEANKTENLSLKLMEEKNHWDFLGKQAQNFIMQGNLEFMIKPRSVFNKA